MHLLKQVQGQELLGKQQRLHPAFQGRRSVSRLQLCVWSAAVHASTAVHSMTSRQRQGQVQVARMWGHPSLRRSCFSCAPAAQLRAPATGAVLDGRAAAADQPLPARCPARHPAHCPAQQGACPIP